MGNFLSDVGRSTLSSSVRDLIQSKISLDANERAGQELGMRQALNAEQLKVLQRQSAAAEEKTRYENTPIPINSIGHLVEFGEQGPLFKHLLGVADSMGLVDKSNPNNPTILRKYLNQDIHEYMKEKAPQLNLMRIDAYNQQIAAAKATLAEKPNDKNALALLESGTKGLQQATMMDAGLKELEKEKSQEKIQAAHDAKAIEAAKISAEASIKGHQISAAATIQAARERKAEDLKNDPEYKMTKDEKWAVDYLKTYKESTTPSPIMAMLAANDPNSPAAKALQQQQNQSLSPEVQAKIAKANAIVDRMIAKNEPKEIEKTSDLPEGLTETTLEYNMKTYNKTRKEVIEQWNKLNRRRQ